MAANLHSNHLQTQIAKKILIYLNEQQLLNKLTAAHLEKVTEQTAEATSEIFSQLSAINGTLNKVSETLLNMSNEKATLEKKNAAITENYEEIAATLKEILNKASNSSTNAHHSVEIETIKDIKTTMDKMVDANTELNFFYGELIDNFSESIKGFAGSILETISHLQFEDSTRQQLEIILKYLDDNNEYVNCLAECVNDKGNEGCKDKCNMPEFDINDILKYYVMDIQRQTHYSVVGGGDDTPTESVTLF